MNTPDLSTGFHTEPVSAQDSVAVTTRRPEEGIYVSLSADVDQVDHKIQLILAGVAQ